ncbi:MAG: hypothetical protein LBS44_03880 [Deltaproteobacteria bacterium]|jgi:nickel transport protein|nr:hypothetical protein [Deltaproteobacteria bacterium]
MPARVLTIFVTVTVFFLAFIAEAKAHSVFIFAWPQGDEICTDSYFSKKSPVKGGTVTISDAAGKILDSAKTDSKGSVCFKRPQTNSDLTFVVMAGEGHRADFLLRAVDLPPLTLSEPAATDAASDANDAAKVSVNPAETSERTDDNIESVAKSEGQKLESINLEALRSVIRQELGSQLGPITRALTEADDKSPTLKDIIGGLGWVVGLFGLAFWYSGRKLRQKK